MTPFGRSLEGAADQPKRMSAAKSNSNRPLMNAVKPAAPTHGRIAKQVPAFAAIGLIGYVVDATITFVGAKYLGLSPELARPPGFIVATIVNFALNRSITFRHARAPLAVSSSAIGWSPRPAWPSTTPSIRRASLSRPIAGIAVTPAILPLFVAAGSGVAMAVTFVGFRFFAFRP